MNGLVRWREPLWSLILSLQLSVLLATSANAHLVNTGLGSFYDGISHILLSPEDLIPVIAIALLAGLNGPLAGRRTLFALAGAWLAGGLAGSLAARPVFFGVATTASLLALGALIAADRRLSPAAVAALAIIVGLLHGWLNGAGIVGEIPRVIALLGIVSTIFVLVAIVAATVVAMHSAWMRLAFRVAGSWIAAIGLLMLGWEFRNI